MSEQDLISVITPVYHAQNTLVRAIRSLQMQTHENWECVLVIDDGIDYASWLSSLSVKDDRLVFTHSNTLQSGPNITRNIGKELASGQWIAPLDADDLFYPNRLERLLSAAQETGLSMDNVSIVDDESNEEIGVAFSRTQHNVTFNEILQSNTPLLMLFHREIASHQWEDIARGGDTIFNLRALEKAKQTAYVPEALHEYRVHSRSLCHAPGAADHFTKAYEETIKRLQEDGFGFKTPHFLERVKDMIQRKLMLNHAYDNALKAGFDGDFQRFCADYL